MEEPQKRSLSIKKSVQEPKKIPMPPLKHLYDDFGYVFSIEKTYPEPMVNDVYIESNNNVLEKKLDHENHQNSD